MSELDLQSLEKVVAFVGEPDEATRKNLRHILTSAGLRQVSVHGNLKNIVNLMQHMTPDLLIVSDDLDPDIFDFIRSIRHNKVGSNPFVLIMTLVAPENVDAVKSAMRAGTDDIIIKPVKEEQLLQRLKRVTVNRAEFVVTSDYLGPDRRAKNRPSNIKRIKVLNTMLNKTSGQEVDGDGVKDAVDGSMNEVLRARLDSHGYRLGFVCNLVIEAYEKNNITEDLKEKIEVLVDILGDAARTAERLKELDLSILCGALSKEIKKILGRYDAPTESDVALLRKASTAVVSAVKPDAPREEIEEESRQAAENYQSRERDGFEETEEIQRRPDEPLPVDFDEPVIEILPLMKGQYLFKEGDEATSAYILSSGSIAIFKEEGGKRIPIARVKKGEFFGEMAIIDSRPRRNSAMALEDCTLSLVSKDMIEEKLANSDKMIRTVLHMLTNSLKSVHDAYSPKSRSIRDSVREIRDQAQHIRTYIDTIASETVRKESAEPAKRVLELSEALIDLVESVPELDRRTPALPSEKDLKG